MISIPIWPNPSAHPCTVVPIIGISTPIPGPLGRNTTAKHRKFSNIIGVAPNISFDSRGRLITVSIKLNSIELHLLDPETLETIALLELPPKQVPRTTVVVATSILMRKTVFCLLQPTTPSQSTRFRNRRKAPNGSWRSNLISPNFARWGQYPRRNSGLGR